ncbi:FecR domain-containing protein [Desulfosporosinus sp. Sb-LF]|uniref:FecR family protein n=1 Tax=Desulfosporosinus sp. Sb-LF TaxID=2560027 RepID=UPI00107EF381|nr:FecR domain-containing protein [Desulfosporosinus sp. Sb-LF]TGE31852.1 hypothetical protein E4K68_14240 [Desulfosporosinus sp. Sb-LF]
MKIKLTTIFIVLVLICSQVILSPKKASAAQPTVKLSSVKGEVIIKIGGGLREFPAVDGTELVQGDWLRTGKNGTAKLSYEDGTEATIGASSYINIQQLTSSDTISVSSRRQARITSWKDGHQSSIQLWAGSVWSKVKSLVNIDDKYEVETPTAVMGVRGTLYLVSIDQETGSTQSDVIDGTVGVTQNNEDTKAAPVQLVTMGQTLKLVSLTEPLPDKQAIDPQRLIKNTQPEILVHLINDITERTMELADKTKEQQKTFSQTGNINDIKAAIGTSSKLVELASFGKEFMSSLQKSDKLEAVKQVLQDNQQTIEQVLKTIDTIKSETEVIKSEVVEAAKAAGVSQEQIDSIGKEAIGVATTPASEPTQNPTPEPTQTPSRGQNSQNNSTIANWLVESVDGGNASDFTLNASAVPAGATYYGLFTTDGAQIDTYKATNATIRTGSIVFSDPSQLVVKFYKDAGGIQMIAKGILSGTVVDGAGSGQMMVTPVTGTWNLGKTFNDAITSDFTINVIGISEATQYEVWANGSAISGKINIIGANNYFRTLSVAFGDMTQLTVKLFDASGNQVGQSILSGTTTNGNGSGAMNY